MLLFLILFFKKIVGFSVRRLLKICMIYDGFFGFILLGLTTIALIKDAIYLGIGDGERINKNWHIDIRRLQAAEAVVS